TTSTICWRFMAYESAQRISFLSHGLTVVFTVGMRGHGSIQPIGGLSVYASNFGFWAWRDFMMLGVSVPPTSDSLFASIWLAVASSPTHCLRISSGAGSLNAPVLAPHQLSLRL